MNEAFIRNGDSWLQDGLNRVVNGVQGSLPALCNTGGRRLGLDLAQDCVWPGYFSWMPLGENAL